MFDYILSYVNDHPVVSTCFKSYTYEVRIPTQWLSSVVGYVFKLNFSFY